MKLAFVVLYVSVKPGIQHILIWIVALVASPNTTDSNLACEAFYDANIWYGAIYTL